MCRSLPVFSLFQQCLWIDAWRSCKCSVTVARSLMMKLKNTCQIIWKFFAVRQFLQQLCISFLTSPSKFHKNILTPTKPPSLKGIWIREDDTRLWMLFGWPDHRNTFSFVKMEKRTRQEFTFGDSKGEGRLEWVAWDISWEGTGSLRESSR